MAELLRTEPGKPPAGEGDYNFDPIFVPLLDAVRKKVSSTRCTDSIHGVLRMVRLAVQFLMQDHPTGAHPVTHLRTTRSYKRIVLREVTRQRTLNRNCKMTCAS